MHLGKRQEETLILKNINNAIYITVSVLYQ
jgi:hypothetical protein